MKEKDKERDSERKIYNESTNAAMHQELMNQDAVDMGIHNTFLSISVLTHRQCSINYLECN